MASSSDSTSKRVKKLQTFKVDYHKKWQFMIPFKKSDNYARYCLCSSDFLIGHGGANDIKSHIKSMRHRSAAEANGSCNITIFLKIMLLFEPSTHDTVFDRTQCTIRGIRSSVKPSEIYHINMSNCIRM